MVGIESQPPATFGSVRRVQALWLALATIAAGVYVAGPISQWAAFQTVCHPDSACQSFQLGATAADTLSRHGISLTEFAVAMMALQATVAILWFGTAGMIIWRKSDDRGAILAAIFLVVVPMLGIGTWVRSDALSNVLGAALVVVLLLFCLLFPDGRFAPRWTRWLALAIVVLDGATEMSLPTILNAIAGISFLTVILIAIAVPIYRYRSISSWGQRQQTKWAILGLAVAMLGILTIWLVYSTASLPAGSGSLLKTTTNLVGFGVVLSAIPLSIGIAVLRNRLWDIDHVINRAMVYSSLTFVLAGLYVGGILGLQALFNLVVGGGSALAIAISTLAIAALFNPVRRRIQVAIDRRFYRSKYDAQRTLAAFSERVRDDVDLAQISRGLTSVVLETLQPEHVSLWLRDGGDGVLLPAGASHHVTHVQRARES
jgi:hypothetical protein